MDEAEGLLDPRTRAPQRSGVMAHNIAGFVHPHSLRDAVIDGIGSYQRVPLGQRFVFVPATDRLLTKIRGQCPQKSGRSFDMFDYLTPSGVGLLELLSRHAPSAYIETQYFGGAGGQSAIVFRGGHLAIGPLVIDAASLAPPPRGDRMGPINQALREVGVRKSGAIDEFEAAGFEDLRDMEEWEED
jgi:hypothetical protein